MKILKNKMFQGVLVGVAIGIIGYDQIKDLPVVRSLPRV